MTFTIEELKANIDAADAKPRCDDNTCEDCLMITMCKKDHAIGDMLAKNLMQVLGHPLSAFVVFIAYVQLGSQIREAQIMKEMFVEKTNSD